MKTPYQKRPAGDPPVTARGPRALAALNYTQIARILAERGDPIGRERVQQLCLGAELVLRTRLAADPWIRDLLADLPRTKTKGGGA